MDVNKLTDESVSQGDSGAGSSYRPELPDFGVYLRWPIEGVDWIHPDDRAVAKGLIPSRKVLRREKWDGEYYWLRYGDQTIRVHPSMWVRVAETDLAVDQQVELLSCHGEHDAGIYRIAEIFFETKSQSIEYVLRRDRLEIPHFFQREDLRPLHVTHKLRDGFYQHAPPKSQLPPGIDLLDVGDLLDGEEG